MGLKSTRKILSVILAVLIAAGTAVMLAAGYISLTVSNGDYLEKHLVTEALVSECESQLERKYELLSAQTAIPSRVFLACETDYPTADSLHRAVQNIFGEEDVSLYSKSRVDYFYEICTQYLSGNEIAYRDADVRNAAEEAARIYSECVGLRNVGAVKDKMTDLKSTAARTSSACALVIVVCVILLAILHNEKRKGVLYLLSGFAGGEIALLLGAMICLLTDTASRIIVTPAVYQQQIAAMIGQLFVMLAVIGAVCLVFTYILLVITHRNVEKNKKD